MATFSIRINTLLLVLLVLMAGAIIAMLATRAYGGPLDPTGPPAATDGVRGPGTPISSLPFAISQPGYYYVTRHLAGAAGQPGITISTSNVTVDLGGFTLIGGTSPGDGISIPTGLRNIVIRNGAVRSWGQGIYLIACSNCRVDRVQASSNTYAGIQIGPRSEVSNCDASLNNGGIIGSSITVRNCTVTENLSTGIYIFGENSLIEGNHVSANGGAPLGPPSGIEIGGSHNMVRDNQLSGNTLTDVLLDSLTAYNVLTGNVYCTAIDNSTFTVSTGNNC